MGDMKKFLEPPLPNMDEAKEVAECLMAMTDVLGKQTTFTDIWTALAGVAAQLCIDHNVDPRHFGRAVKYHYEHFEKKPDLREILETDDGE